MVGEVWVPLHPQPGCVGQDGDLCAGQEKQEPMGRSAGGRSRPQPRWGFASLFLCSVQTCSPDPAATTTSGTRTTVDFFRSSVSRCGHRAPPGFVPV